MNRIRARCKIYKISSKDDRNGNKSAKLMCMKEKYTIRQVSVMTSADG